jgi:hypothetical protein
MQDRKVVLDLEIRSTGVPACVEKLGAIGEIGGSFPRGHRRAAHGDRKRHMIVAAIEACTGR